MCGPLVFLPPPIPTQQAAPTTPFGLCSRCALPTAHEGIGLRGLCPRGLVAWATLAHKVGPRDRYSRRFLRTGETERGPTTEV